MKNTRVNNTNMDEATRRLDEIIRIAQVVQSQAYSGEGVQNQPLGDLLNMMTSFEALMNEMGL